jgi:hypothetical protein
MSKLIFSVFQASENKATNIANTRKAMNYMKQNKVSFKVVQGCYKGSKEVSFVVPFGQIWEVLKLARIFKQESFLELDNHNNAVLNYLNEEKRVRIGKITPVSKEEALSSEAYTKSGKVYLVCK